MIHVTCRLTAKNRDQLRNPTLGSRVRAAFVRQLLSAVQYISSCRRYRRSVAARSYLATPTVHLHSSLLSPVDRTALSRPVRRSISDQLPAVSASVTVPCPSVCLSRQAKASKRAAGSAAQHQAGRVLCRDPRYKERQRIVWAAAPEHITSMRLFIYNFISPSYMVAQH